MFSNSSSVLGRFPGLLAAWCRSGHRLLHFKMEVERAALAGRASVWLAALATVAELKLLMLL